MGWDRINGKLFKTCHVSVEDLPAIHQAGFKSILCNRPDGDDRAQPAFAEISAAASRLGMRALYIPMAVGAVGDEAAKAFRRAAATLPQPVLAYCASGRRVAAVAEKAGLSERGKIILAEFGYGAKRISSFPKWLIDALQPSRIAWYLKEQGLPRVYWHGMLKGREPMPKPRFAGPVV